jgi:hypothetical protein
MRKVRWRKRRSAAMEGTKGNRYLEANTPFHGRKLATLLAKADAQHELMLLAGKSDTYELEAIYDLMAEEWTVQLHDCSRGIGCSLYHMN